MDANTEIHRGDAETRRDENITPADVCTRVCSRCKARPARPGQRYCRGCHALAGKEYRARLAEKLRGLQWLATVGRNL